MIVAMIQIPSAGYLKSLLDYNPETGRLIWRTRPSTSKANMVFNIKHSGKEAGTLESWGYRQVRINGRLTMAHRIIWKMMTEQEPPDHLDHIDGDVSNNRWTNLRIANALTSSWNRKVNHTSATGLPCIYEMHTKRKTSKKFRVVMRNNGKRMFIGDFHTLEQAKAAYEEAFDKFRDIEYMRNTP
jgi:hypothetical protein